MNKNRVFVLTLAMIFILACSIGTTPQTQPPVVEQATYTPLPTYTPYPTVAVEQPTEVGASTQVAEPTATESFSFSPEYNAILLRANDSVYGTTKENSILYYFEGQQGQTISLVLVGDPKYQEFSLRNSDNNGLIGCDINSQTTCSITDFKLPYTGIYYVLVDRTFVDNYKQLQSCVNNPPYASWCYRGGPFSLDLIIR